MIKSLEEAERKLNYRFKDKRLLVQAFTHSSVANLEGSEDNERMEFFGDAVLQYLSSEYVYSRYRHKKEGELSALRAHLVSAEALAEIVDGLGIMPYFETLNGDCSRKGKANLFEAVLCAIYLDGGMDSAREFFLAAAKDKLSVFDGLKKDAKTLLQEYCQKHRLTLEYKETGREGPDNKPLFRCELYVDGKKQTDGEGYSKKAAEQDAASKLVVNWRLD